MATIPLLVVGAGPTGMMVALQLARRGVPVRIFDRNPGPSTKSKAVAVQARTLEHFHQLGFAVEAVRRGRCLEQLYFCQNGKIQGQLEIGRVGVGMSRYPYMLALGQDQTEELLMEQLTREGVTIEWNTEAVGLEDLGDRVRVRLRHGGAEETVEASWVLGCDGASSIVRQKCGFTFEGGTYEHRFYLVDCRVDGPIPHDCIFVCPDRKALTAFFAMHDERRFRIIGRVPDGLAQQQDLPFSIIKDLAAKGTKLPLTLSDPRWSSVYRLHHRCVNSFRKGRCFVIGDAAHVHSPVGGQGMNTGLQDGTNLAWKLAMVVQGAAREELLDTYQEERLPFAHWLVTRTDRLFKMATSSGAIATFLRMNLFPHLFRFIVRRFRKRLFATVGQIWINYREGRLAARAREAGSIANKRIAPGDRLPFVTFAGPGGVERDLGDVIHSHWFTAFAIGVDADGSQSAEIATLSEELERLLPGRIAIRTIAATPANAAAIEGLGCDGLGACLLVVRPDLHVLGVWRGLSAAPVAECLGAIM